MKFPSRLIPITFLCLLILCGCSRDPNLSQASVVPEPITEYRAALSSYLSQDTPIQTIVLSHGIDAPIVWEDEGFEAHIRFLLDRPTGDIYRSDVWNIQTLEIMERVDGWDSYRTGSDSESTLNDLFLYKKTHGENQTFPLVMSLNDLQHFDSLQVFHYSSEPLCNEQLIDFSGLQFCNSLKILSIKGTRPKSLEPLSHLKFLRELTLSNCGTLDLLPLQNLPELSHISLTWSDHLVSLDPLTSLPQLTYLSLASGTTFPSLEPLTRTNIQALDLGLSIGDDKLYQQIDYAPLTQMPNLVYLNLMNHSKATTKFCKQLLSSSPALQFLDISYTPASESSQSLTVPYLNAPTQVMFSQRLINKLRNAFA